MRVLVTGGTGLIGRSTVGKLRERGHDVCILSRHAERNDDAGITAWPASVGDAERLHGAADNCDVVLHIAGIVSETPPDMTFQTINIEGTANLLAEAGRAAVPRFIYLSSMGADFGESDYHRSKLAAEERVRAYSKDWVIARPGNVYGPGDEIISRLVKYVRSLPAVPVLDGGDQPFQPIWHNDLAHALVELVEGHGRNEIFELAGPDVVTVNTIFDVIGDLTDREPARVPVASTIVGWLASLAESAGIDPPVHSDTLQMLRDGIYVREGRRNALPDLIDRPTSLDAGLRWLLQDLPTQSIEDGFGQPRHRRVSVRIQDAQRTARELFDAFVADYNRFLPVDAATEPGSPLQLREGAVVPLTLPLIGNVAVRVEEAANQAITLSTLDGHPLAGFVRFTFAEDAGDIVFEVNVYDRPANVVSTIGMTLGGNFAQRRAWRTAAERVLEAAGGTSRDGVQHEVRDLAEAEVTQVQHWFERLTSRDRDNRDPPA